MMSLLCISVTAWAEKSKDYTQYVNPFIGTGGHGHTFPGAVYPHGMIQPSPDTRIYQWDACSGYHYSDSTINGFSHTHLSGTGCGDYGDILIMPTVGHQDWRHLGEDSQKKAYASAFSHRNEVARPGYYAVTLDRYRVKAELTATPRVALHRYTFPETREAGFVIDLDYSLQNQENSEMELRIIGNNKVCGRKKTKSWAFEQYICFYAEFSKPFTYTLITDSILTDKGKRLPTSKALLHFATEANEEVMVKVGISAVDIDGARKNLEKELPDWNFDRVYHEAKTAWNTYLSTIEVETTDLTHKNIFYTSLYHTGIHPNLFSDADGRYRGMDLKVHQGDTLQQQYTIFSLWDTFRAFHPLMTIIRPTLNQAFIRSLLQKSKEGGVLPMWELAGNYTATMIGYHAVSVIADAYMKGQRDFDVKAAYAACLRAAEYDTLGIVAPRAMVHGLMPPAKYWKSKLGYVPCDKDNEAVAKGLEYAYNDWCISLLAQAMKDKPNAKKYLKLSKAYTAYFDSSIRFMRGKDSSGKWRKDFNPRSSNHRNDDYCEGTAWQWTWFVPHDVKGLVKLMGGEKSFTAKLDSLFTADSSLEGALVSADISGLIGQYAHGNEPSHHIIHLYNHVDEYAKAQKLINDVLYTLYDDAPDGLSGNEDCGQMSAWYIMNAMGFYQISPGNPTYSIGRPIFDRVRINLSDGKFFTITTQNNNRTNKYIQSIKLNGKRLRKPFFTHEDIEKGGRLEFIMGSKPPKTL